jgi:CheY-like chemotaxis protein
VPSPEAPSTDSEDALRGSATILLVDDESALVHAIGEFLRESGYIGLDAFSSQDALDLAKEYASALFLPKPCRFSSLLTSLRQLQSRI